MESHSFERNEARSSLVLLGSSCRSQLCFVLGADSGFRLLLFGFPASFSFVLFYTKTMTFSFTVVTHMLHGC
jgi:hypothetical protein